MPRTAPFLATLALLTLAAHTFAATPFPELPKPTDSFTAGTLHVDQFGAGPQPLLLIPGLACGPWVWADTITRLAPTHTLYVLTLPGFDGHPATPQSPLFATVTKDVWQLLADRKIQKPVLIGHSLGGTLGFALAAEHPDRLSALIALDGLPVFPTLANTPPDQRTQLAAQMAKTTAALSPADFLVSQTAYMRTTGTNRPDLIDPAAKHLAKSDPAAVAAWIKEDLATDLRPSLKNITLPILELMPYDPADKSPYTQDQTLTFYQSLLAGAPKATVLPLTPARRFAMLDQPDAFHKALTDFLSTLPR